MEKIKKIFHSMMLCFTLVSSLCLGLFLTGQKSGQMASADFAEYGVIENESSDYLSVLGSSSTEVEMSDDKSIFLIRGNGAVDFSIGQDVIVRAGAAQMVAADGSPATNADGSALMGEGRNYAYIPNKSQVTAGDETDFYYFRFSSALSLYYNKTNKDLNDESQLTNLLDGQLITNFTQEHADNHVAPSSEGTGSMSTYAPFYVDSIDGVPQLFNIAFSLQTSAAGTVTVNGSSVTLGDEGCYTIVIPGRAYHTTDGGKTFSSSDIDIKYTFMIFNYDTYFDTGSRLPNTSMTRVQETPLANSATHSKYFFYNYTSSTPNNVYELPTYRYDPLKYQMSVAYTDTDNNSYSSTIEYDNITGAITQKDQAGNVIADKNLFVLARLDKTNGELVLTFNDLGQYDLSFEFIYTGTNGVFELPLTALRQRLNIYGYQVLYTDYSDIDENTNTTRSKELKEIDAANSKFQNAAEVTEQVVISRDSEGQPIFHRSTDFLTSTRPTLNGETAGSDLFTAAVNAIKSGEIKLISTNQTPIKFRANAVKSAGHIFKLDAEGEWQYEDEFTGTNINEAGTYLILVDYTFNGYMSSTGTNQSSHHHYQIFYFTVENKMPSVSVVDVNGKEIYTKGFTNKSVYVFDTSASTLYDADVTISLSAYNYANKTYYFEDYEISDPALAAYGITYFKDDMNIELDAYKGKPQTGVLIDASQRNQYRNAQFTISIQSKNTSTPSKRSFTIDTNAISDINAFNVQFASSSSYTIGQQVQGNMTNQSVVFSWENKLSGAQTYGYYKFFPIETTQYYSNGDNSLLLYDLMDNESAPNVLPVNAVLNMEQANAWVNYTNAYEFTNGANALNSVPSTYARSSAGIYLFEVYDDAGNANFELYLLDNTSPLFVKKIRINESGLTSRAIAEMNETITVSEANTASIIWAKYKGLYIQNYNLENIIKNLNPTGNLTEEDTAALSDIVSKFFSDNSINIRGIAGNLGNKTGEGALPYASQYLRIAVDDNFYYRHAEKNNFTASAGTTYDIEFFKTIVENGVSRKEAIEGTYKFLVRDASNARKTADNPEYDFVNYPSGYLSINVSADASEVKITTPAEDALGNKFESELDKEGYSLSGQFYEDDNHTILSKNEQENLTKGDLSYKYSYYRPVKTQSPLTLSFRPAPENGSIVQSVILEYYPYVKDFEKITANRLGQEFEATAWFYRLATEPERTIPIYTYSASDGYTENDIISRVLTFDGSNIAAPGKYVIIRTYSRENTIDDYDYYERDLTLYVDRYNVISPQEVITGMKQENGVWVEDGETSLESIVGGDILISMYSQANQNQIQISFPNYDNRNGMNLNSGSLYTTGNMTENSSISNILNTNKLPFNILVPQYKYTNYYSYNKADNSYSVKENQSLSRFGDAYIIPINRDNKTLIERTDSLGNLYYQLEEDGVVSTAQLYGYVLYVHGIRVNTFLDRGQASVTKAEAEAALAETEVSEYKLKAVITHTYQDANGQYHYNYFATNGTGSNGYLNFYQVPTKTSPVPTGATAVTNFTDAGTYDVAIYQASLQGTTSDFYDFYRFSFTVERPAPEFEVLTGEEVQLNEAGSNNYYTNTKEILIRWEDSDSDYIANIDRAEIKLYKNGSEAQAIPVTEADIITTGRTHTISVNLESNGLWANGRFLTIRMQFEGHNEFYETTTKTVYIDFSAPVQNLAGLMENIQTLAPSQFTRLYQERNMRELYDSDSNLVPTNSTNWGNASLIDTNMLGVSYSYSASSGTMRYYAYNVTHDYLKAIKNSIRPSTANEVQRIYTRLIGKQDDLVNYTQVRNESFSAQNYIPLHDLSPSEIDDSLYYYDSYYEVVEMDTAGNMTVYIVHLYDATADTAATEEAHAIKYSNQRLDKKSEYLNDRDLDDSDKFTPNAHANIYSNSGFTIQGLNYLSDPWGIYRVVTNYTNRATYMRSPWIEEDEILRITQNGSTIRFETVKLSSLFANITSSANKHSIEITDRFNAASHTVLVSIMDSTLVTTKSSTNEAALLNIQVPTADLAISDTTAAVFPVSIKVSHFSGDAWQPISTFTNPSGDPEAWTSEIPQITFLYSNNNLTVRIALGTVYNSKLKYEITDNFGYVTTVIQVANEETCEEIIGEDFYTFTEPDGTTTYISARAMTYQYNNLLHTVRVYYLNDRGVFTLDRGTMYSTYPISATINSIRFNDALIDNYNKVYQIQIFDTDADLNDPETLPIRTIQLKFYYKLPVFIDGTSTVGTGLNTISFRNKDFQYIAAANTDPTRPTIETLTMNGVTYTDSATLLSTYSSNVTLSFTASEQNNNNFDNYHYLNEYGYSVYLTTDGINYTNLNEFATGYRISGAGNYKILVVYDDTSIFRGACRIFDLTILDSSSVFYTVTVDGNIISRNDIRYTLNGREYTENYIVSVDYSEHGRVDVLPNRSEDEDMRTELLLLATYPTGTNVYIEVYSYTSKISSGNFTIIYMGETNSIVSREKLSYDDASGTPIRINPQQATTLTIVADETQVDYSRLKLTWNAYYGISVNKINIEVSKLFNNNFVPVNLTIYSSQDGEDNYTYLTRSGTYRIRFYDSCQPANNQAFGNGNYLNIVFLKDVPFTVTYRTGNMIEGEDGTQVYETATTEPIQRAVYNGAISLNLVNLSSYFQTLGYPTISVTKDGAEYTNYTLSNYVYSFSEPGYYTVRFAATSAGGTVLREETYSFTIINQYESRYSYEFASFGNYYVESVIKDGQDITQNLIDFAGNNSVIIGNKIYLSRLLVSYFDERTGAGRYTVTINTGDKNYTEFTRDGNTYAGIADQTFTFSFWINITTPPITVSIAEGESTNKTISITFNAYNLYDAVGDCYIQIGSSIYYVNAHTLEELGGENCRLTITQKGTYYIQVYSTSNTLLYSYKVTKTDPLNTWAIIAIVLGIVAVGVIVFITIKLRKRLKVK